MIPAVLNTQTVQAHNARIRRPAIHVDTCTPLSPPPTPCQFPSRPIFPGRAATAPTPSPTRSDSRLSTFDRPFRWSDIVPPETGLTFGAVYDPEDGMVTFSGAELSTCPSNATLRARATSGMDSPVDPLDPDNRSQVFTIEKFAVGAGMGTGMGASARLSVGTSFGYSLATPLPSMHNARCSSAGTSLALDTYFQSSRTTLSRNQSGANSQMCSPSARSRHMLKPGKPSFSRRVPLSSLSTPLKEMFSDPFWNVSGPLLRLGEYGKKHAAERSAEQLGHNVRWENEVLERRAEINDDYADDEEDIEEEDEPEEEETYPGYVHVEFTDDDDGEEWYEEDGEDSVQYARRSRTTLEENNNLKSAFSWSSTSTSRYIDVSSTLLPEWECENGAPCLNCSAYDNDLPANNHQTQTQTQGHNSLNLSLGLNNRFFGHRRSQTDEAVRVSITEWSTLEPPSGLSTPNLLAYLNSQPSSKVATPRKLQKPRRRARAKSESNASFSPPSAPAEEVLARSEYNHERSESDHSCSTKYSSTSTAGGGTTSSGPVLRVKLGLKLKPVLGSTSRRAKCKCKGSSPGCMEVMKRLGEMKAEASAPPSPCGSGSQPQTPTRSPTQSPTQTRAHRSFDSERPGCDSGVDVSSHGRGFHARCRSEDTTIAPPVPPLPLHSPTRTPTSSRPQTWIQRRSGISAHPLNAARSLVRELKLSNICKDYHRSHDEDSDTEAGWVSIHVDKSSGLEVKSLAPLSPRPPMQIPDATRPEPTGMCNNQTQRDCTPHAQSQAHRQRCADIMVTDAVNGGLGNGSVTISSPTASETRGLLNAPITRERAECALWSRRMQMQMACAQPHYPIPQPEPEPMILYETWGHGRGRSKSVDVNPCPPSPISPSASPCLPASGLSRSFPNSGHGISVASTDVERRYNACDTIIVDETDVVRRLD